MSTTFQEPQVEVDNARTSTASRAVGASARTIQVSSFDPFAVRRPAAPATNAPRFTVPLSAGLRREEPVAAPGGVLRLTRRGRILALAVVTFLVFLAFSVGRVSSNAATPPHVAPVKTVMVAPGDTLWGIAQEIAPNRDPRAVIDELSRANHLTGALQVGQTLVIPTH